MPSSVETRDSTIELGKWTDGIVNAIPGKGIPNSALLDAVNVDIDDSGAVRRRRGFSKEVSSSGISNSLYSKAGRMFFADNGQIKEVVKNGSSYSTSPLVSGMPIGEKVSFAEAHGSYYWSGKSASGKITGTSNMPFGVETPSGNPVLTSNPGNLFAGDYKVAVCFVASNGEQSGARNAEAITIAENSSIVLSSIPQPIDPDVSFIRVFISEANGSTLYRLVDLPVGTTSYIATKSTNKGMSLRTELFVEFPRCEIIAYWRGRMLGADGSVLWHSEPMMMGLINPMKNFTPFDSEITMVRAVEDGFYVAADKTYFISGDSPENWTKREVFPYGAVKFSDYENDKDMTVGWMSKFGTVVAGNGGEAKNVSMDRFAVEYEGCEGASMRLRRNGIDSVVSTVAAANSSSMICSDYAEVVVIRGKRD